MFNFEKNQLFKRKTKIMSVYKYCIGKVPITTKENG